MPVRYSDYSDGPDTRRSLTGVMSAPSYVDYSTWTKPELVAELEKRGLDKYGNKPELAARLQADDA